MFLSQEAISRQGAAAGVRDLGPRQLGPAWEMISSSSETLEVRSRRVRAAQSIIGACGRII